MARRIQAEDMVDVAGSPDAVFAVLWDVARYPDWWPAALRVRHIGGGEVEVRPRASRFRCRLGDAEPPYWLTVQYVDGPQRGEGIWTLQALPHGATRVCYRIDLEPHGLIARLLSYAMDFAAIHSRQMRPVLAALARRVAN